MRRAGDAPRSPQPSRRNAGLARFFLDVGDRLGLLGRSLSSRVELGDRALALEFELRALRRIVAIDDVGGERVEPALQGVGENAAALERRPRSVDARAPIRLIFDFGSALPPGRLSAGTCVLWRRRRGRVQWATRWPATGGAASS